MTEYDVERQPAPKKFARAHISKGLILGPLAAGFFGNAFVALYSWSVRSLGVYAVFTLVSLGAGFAGAAAGFLFGLPRYAPTLSRRITEGSSGRDSSTGQFTSSVYSPSNNLEQVSDWLTKLLIGAGLVQLGVIANGLTDLTRAIAATTVMGPASPESLASAQIVAGSILIVYVVLGFLALYAGTALSYRRLLEEYEEDWMAAWRHDG